MLTCPYIHIMKSYFLSQLSSEFPSFTRKMTICCYFSGISKYVTSDKYVLLDLFPKEMQPCDHPVCSSVSSGQSVGEN